MMASGSMPKRSIFGWRRSDLFITDGFKNYGEPLASRSVELKTTLYLVVLVKNPDVVESRTIPLFVRTTVGRPCDLMSLWAITLSPILNTITFNSYDERCPSIFRMLRILAGNAPQSAKGRVRRAWHDHLQSRAPHIKSSIAIYKTSRIPCLAGNSKPG